MLSLLLVLQFALPSDSVALRVVGEKYGVPKVVMYAVAWQESRVNVNPNLRGPGREQCDGLGCRRVCREVGRMQVNPCIGFKLTGCKQLQFYAQNITCAAGILGYLYDKYGSWGEVIRRYNGSGPRSRRYQQEALAYIGWLTLERRGTLEN